MTAGVAEASEVVRLVSPVPGHFDLGTGYHGNVWLDLDALLLRPSLFTGPASGG
jgi:hypothetical protein